MNREACVRGTLCELENLKIWSSFNQGEWKNMARELVGIVEKRVPDSTLTPAKHKFRKAFGDVT